MPRILFSALMALSLVGCGSTSSPTATSFHEMSARENESAVTRAQQHLRGQQVDMEEVVARSVIVDDTGAEHVRFDKRYKGLRVIGGDFVVHSHEDGTLREISASSAASLQGLDVKPILDSTGAVVLAERAFTGRRVGPAKAELVISMRQQPPVLAYEVVLEGSREDTLPSRLHVLVDADTGAQLESWDEINTLQTTGQSLYSGTVPITVLSSGALGYALWDTTRGNGFKQYDAKNQTSGVFLYFQNHDNLWGDGTIADRESAAVDVHYAMAMTYDYFKNVHGRNGIDGAGNMGYGVIHYGNGVANAFWDDTCFCVSFGDAGGTNGPFTGMDMAAHEMTHGVTSHSAGLIYSGESGGLNEATSDIFGTLVEFYANNPNDPGDYLIGEEFVTMNTPGDALRYMYLPGLNGSAKNCYYSTIGAAGNHNSSGPANHFFYLLAEGSNSTPATYTCNGSTITGIGRDAAGKIWYRALTVYMTSSTTYAGARQATLNAAMDLYGQGSTQYNAVAAAWSAVSVN